MIKSEIQNSRKDGCIYCGNNPTNHLMAYVFQTAAIPLGPVARLFAILENRYIYRFALLIMTPYIWAFVRLRIWGLNDDPEKAYTERSKVIWQEANARGIPMQQLVVFGKHIEQYRAKINGKWQYFESIPLPDHFKATSYSWMDDKWTLKKFLEKHNIPVAYGRSVSSKENALEVFTQGKPPFIAKPRLGSRGRHTSTFLYSENELIKGFEVAKMLCQYVIVEEHLTGSVYRGTYVNGEVVGILAGDPPRITGDGKSTIEKLIEHKNASKHKEVKDVTITPSLIEFIRRQGLLLDTILPRGKTVDLSEKIGINYGGNAVEVTHKTHPKIIEYIRRAGDALGAPVVGFDFIIPDITADPDTERWGIIEANSLPFINLHHFPLEGTPINVAAKVWDLWNKPTDPTERARG